MYITIADRNLADSVTGLIGKKKKQVKEPTDRELWAGVLYRMAAPVLSNLSEGKLQQNMLVEVSPTWDGRNKKVTYMECFWSINGWVSSLDFFAGR